MSREKLQSEWPARLELWPLPASVSQLSHSEEPLPPAVTQQTHHSPQRRPRRGRRAP